jgi:hypothetical protein
MNHKKHVEPSQPWAWGKRIVDPAEEHFEVRYGSADSSDWNAWILVARVGRPINRMFGVQFMNGSAANLPHLFQIMPAPASLSISRGDVALHTAKGPLINYMNHKKHVEPSQPWAWGERIVDPAEEHFEVRYGSADSSDWSSWVLIARVGRPINRVFGVQFFNDSATPRSVAMTDAVIADLDFYLVTKGEPDPWVYAQYQCGTSSNLYSLVHWSFQRGQKVRDAVAGDAKPAELAPTDE